ncbi:hypothetical protein ABK040_007257 [Willaertia magna]
MINKHLPLLIMEETLTKHWKGFEQQVVNDLTNKSYCVIDNFLPKDERFKDIDLKSFSYAQIVNLYKSNELKQELSVIEDEETGQVTEVLGKDPFYTIYLNDKNKEEDENKQFLSSLVLCIGNYFQKILFEQILKLQWSLAESQKTNFPFYNKVALCKDFHNMLPKHFDNDGTNEFDTRKLTIVYYTTPNENRNWKGGNLRIFKPSKDLYKEDETIDIEPICNRAVLFYSDIVVHSVTPIIPINNNNNVEENKENVKEEEVTPPRTTITVWIPCYDYSLINVDKILYQRQILKHFQ